jgi:hypothetical protein
VRGPELMAPIGRASMRAALIYQYATSDRDAAVARALSKLTLAEPEARPQERRALRAQGRARSGRAGVPEAPQRRPKDPRYAPDLGPWSGRRESNPRSQFGRLGTVSSVALTSKGQQPICPGQRSKQHSARVSSHEHKPPLPVAQLWLWPRGGGGSCDE